MKNEAVTLMRNIRDQMSKEIEGMSWKDEQKYLRKQINVFWIFAIRNLYYPLQDDCLMVADGHCNNL